MCLFNVTLLICSPKDKTASSIVIAHLSRSPEPYTMPQLTLTGVSFKQWLTYRYTLWAEWCMTTFCYNKVVETTSRTRTIRGNRLPIFSGLSVVELRWSPTWLIRFRSTRLSRVCCLGRRLMSTAGCGWSAMRPCHAWRTSCTFSTVLAGSRNCYPRMW